MEDTSKRALTTAEGKRLYIEAENMGLDIKESRHTMSMEDETGITLASGKAMKIFAIEGIGINAKVVTIETIGALNLLRDPER